MFGMFPAAWSAFSADVLVNAAIQSAAELLVPADRNGEVGAAEEARHRLAGRVARHHELRGRALVLVADAAGEPAGADDRAGVAVRVHAVRGRTALVGRSCSAREAAAKKFLYAVSPAIDLRRVERALPLAADLRGDLAAEVVDEAHRDVPVGARDVDRRVARSCRTSCSASPRRR